MSAIALEIDVDEPPAGVQDELLLLKAREEHKAAKARRANREHVQARERLIRLQAELSLPDCPDEEL